MIFKSAVAASVSFLLNSLSYNDYSSSYNALNSGVISETLRVDYLRALAGDLASGSVLEVAVGTGLQFPYYSWDRISKYVGIDISEGMLREAIAAMPQAAEKVVSLKIMDATSMDLGDVKFDVVLDSFSLCVISEPAKTIAEMDRLVKKPGGKIILLENTRSQMPLVGLFQDLTEPIVTPLSKQCRWNTDVERLAHEAGLKLTNRVAAELGTISLSVYSPSEL